jgi:RNA polymerase sigma-70 factor (ECF subfamily)
VDRSDRASTAREDPDAALVSRVRRGDIDAFDEIVRRYEHRIVNYVRAMVSRSVEAEDVAQEVFLRAFKSLRTFRGRSSFKTWLYQIATNTARTHGARRGRRVEDAVGTLDGEGADGPPPAVSPEDLEARILLRDRLDRALAQLPADQRDVIVLRDVEGFEYLEIARMLGIPIGTVESRIFRGRARLRELLRPEES